MSTYLILWGLVGLFSAFGIMIRFTTIRKQLDLVDVTILPLFSVIFGPAMLLILLMMVGEDVIVWRKK